jgi:hypothetical protein
MESAHTDIAGSNTHDQSRLSYPAPCDDSPSQVNSDISMGGLIPIFVLYRDEAHIVILYLS